MPLFCRGRGVSAFLLSSRKRRLENRPAAAVVIVGDVSWNINGTKVTRFLMPACADCMKC